MPPKSSSSRKSGISWFLCEKCATNIIIKDRNGHENICEQLQSDDTKCQGVDFVRNHSLHSSTIEKRTFAVEELKEVSEKQVNNLVFISEGVMKLCKFYIGQDVCISSSGTELESAVKLVRKAWPIPDKFLSTIFLGSEDHSNYSHNLRRITVEKLSSSPKPVKELTVEVVETSGLELSDIWKKVSKILQVELRGKVLCKNTKIYLDFFNKNIELVLKSFQTHIDDLADQMENLSLTTDRFYLITNSTRIVLHEPKKLQNESEEVLEDKVKLKDIGGLETQIQQVLDTFEVAVGLKKVPRGIKISRATLLYGPTGCGKTMICEALSNEYISKISTIKINSSEIFSKFFGETEKNLQEYFQRAFENYPKPTLIIVENLQNICPKNESTEILNRVSMAFMNLLDTFQFNEKANKLFVLATCGNIENLNPSIRRCGRFDSEVEIPAPNPSGRLDILTKYLNKLSHKLSDEATRELANVTHGYVASDLANLIHSAALRCLNEKRQDFTEEDVNYALSQVKPSAMREVLIESPNVSWADIGGQEELKFKLKQAIEWPLLYPEKFKKMGIKPPRGILMFGPPGCSKTMIAKALATESKVNFLSIKGPELFSMWVGESERAVREVFRKARQVAPSIIFFDEIDAIGGERSSENGSVKERVLTQLLTELDGVDTLKDVTIVAATNRPDMMDKALLRPGRIDRIVYVSLPDKATRREIFRIKLQNMPVSEEVALEVLVEKTEGYSGAEIQAICHEAALKTLEESFEAKEVTWKHFEYALNAVQPRTSPQLLGIYDDYLKQC